MSWEGERKGLHEADVEALLSNEKPGRRHKDSGVLQSELFIEKNTHLSAESIEIFTGHCTRNSKMPFFDACSSFRMCPCVQHFRFLFFCGRLTAHILLLARDRTGCIGRDEI